VQYQYYWEGKSYISNQVWTDSKKATDQYEVLGELLYQDRNGGLRECFVNPKDSSQAALVKEGNRQWIFALCFAIFGGFFASIGIAMIFWG